MISSLDTGVVVDFMPKCRSQRHYKTKREKACKNWLLEVEAKEDGVEPDGKRDYLSVTPCSLIANRIRRYFVPLDNLPYALLALSTY